MSDLQHILHDSEAENGAEDAEKGEDADPNLAVPAAAVSDWELLMHTSEPEAKKSTDILTIPEGHDSKGVTPTAESSKSPASPASPRKPSLVVHEVFPLTTEESEQPTTTTYDAKPADEATPQLSTPPPESDNDVTPMPQLSTPPPERDNAVTPETEAETEITTPRLEVETATDQSAKSFQTVEPMITDQHMVGRERAYSFQQSVDVEEIQLEATTPFDSQRPTTTTLGRETNIGFYKDTLTDFQPTDRKEPPSAHKPTEELPLERQTVGYFELYRYADCWDYLSMLMGSLSAAACGAGLPLVFLFFGDMIHAFVGYGKYSPCDYNYQECYFQGRLANGTTFDQFNELIDSYSVKKPSDLEVIIADISIVYAAIGAGSLFFGFLQIVFWVIPANRQMKRIRVDFFRSILNQDIGFFDVNSSSELNMRLAEDVDRIQAGISDTASMAIMNISRFISGLALGFANSWKLSLVILSASPLLGVAAACLFQLMSFFTRKELKAYAKAGAIAEQAIAAIRTVVAFEGQEIEVRKYARNLKEARRVGIQKGFSQGCSIGFLFMVIFCMYGVSLYYGFVLVDAEEIAIDKLITSFFAMLIGAFSLGQAGSNIESFGIAKAAAFKIFQVIDRKPIIDSFSNAGNKPDHVVGEITIQDVSFSYPARPDVQILNSATLVAEPGKTTALCGQSGCGKSTCIQLIQRFYDPQNGAVLLDGVDIRTLNVRWLRKNIGVVSQEPCLFSTTIEENIRFGCQGVTHEEIVEAAKLSSAYDFIQNLPHKFQTMVGESGGQLSGGQKQRIAIARAIVRNPKIMLLDEATSALDTVSEGIVQSALDKASKGRTTIVVAHRLSTIKNADKIVGFHSGHVVERGSHAELVRFENGVYANLVRMQSTARPQQNSTLRSSSIRRSSLRTSRRLSSVRGTRASIRTSAWTENESAVRPSTGPEHRDSRRSTINRSTVASSKQSQRQARFSSDMAERREELRSTKGYAKLRRDTQHRVSAMNSRRTSLMSRRTSRTPTLMDLYWFQHRPSWKSIDSDEFYPYLEEDEEELLDEEDEVVPDVSFCRIFSLNSPEYFYIFVGCILSCITGAVQPFMSLFFAGIMDAFTLPRGDKQTDDIIYFAWCFVFLGLIVFVSNIVQSVCFAKSGEELTLRLRTESFRAVLRQDMGYFDNPRNSVGAITTRLANDASRIQGATGIRIGSMLQSVFGLATAMVIAFVYSWQLALVATCFIPFIALGAVLHMQNISGQSGNELRIFEEAGAIATQASTNIRTVQALSLEHYFLDQYKEKLTGPYKKAVISAISFGFTFGYSQSIIMFNYAACYRYGAYLAANEIIEFSNVFRVLMAVLFGTFTVGQANAFAPDMEEARNSAGRIFKLLDRIPDPDSYSEEGTKLPEKEYDDERLNDKSGKIRYNSVNFVYPNRPESLVLNGMTTEILPGQTVALVGESGCGKSTCIQLLERFYNPLSGTVTYDDEDVRNLHIGSLRRKLGIVSQEPVLFDRSIADNIRYGDTSRVAHMDEVVAAAKQSNIHDFIEALPEGYYTNVGSKGTQLSGGQKQRIAIARALLRNPKVLLLDEATSALDTESEKIVQQALDRAREGRTCIVIAHRLSTVQHADKICVVDGGRVVESGTHEQLINNRRSYYSLVNTQLHYAPQSSSAGQSTVRSSTVSQSHP